MPPARTPTPRSNWIVGVDPGMTGAVAMLPPPPEPPILTDIPTNLHKGRRRLDLGQLRRLVAQHRHAVWVVEAVHPHPKHGTIAGFVLGESYGALRGLLVAYRVQHSLVSPQRWKGDLHVPADKELARRRALDIFPQLEPMLARKKDHNRAEALLLAEWLRRQG